MTAKIRMPVHIDPNIVKIAVELEGQQAQLIEFDQKVSLTSKYGSQATHNLCLSACVCCISHSLNRN